MELLYQHQHKQVCEAQNNSWLVSRKQVVHKQLVQIQIVKSSVFRKQVWGVSDTKEAYTVEITAD